MQAKIALFAFCIFKLHLINLEEHVNKFKHAISCCRFIAWFI